MSVKDEIAPKISVSSNFSGSYEAKEKFPASKHEFEMEPKDPFFLVHACCLFVGFLNVMPLLFFSTAAGYWLYKFRDPAFGDTTAGKNRTTLQVYYMPSSAVASLLPSLSFNFILTFYGHKCSAMLRLIWSLFLIIGLFLIFALFTQINTDSWQNGFFVFTMFCLAINVALTSTIGMSSSVLIAKLPNEYMFFFLLGQNGTLFTTTLQIIALSVTDYQPTTGLIYFLSGATIIAITLLLLVIARQSKIFKYYDVEDTKEQKPETVNWNESKTVIKRIWPCQVIIGLLILTVSCIHPSITTLVVSQNEASQTAWTKKYFTPVGFFLVFEIGSLTGRLITRKVCLTHSNKFWFIGYNGILLFVCAPFYLFCNAQSRTLPVYFDKDWEFIIGNFVFGFSCGFLINVAFMSIKNLAGNKQEAALKLMTLTSTVCSALTVANGLMMVKLLNI